MFPFRLKHPARRSVPPSRRSRTRPCLEELERRLAPATLVSATTVAGLAAQTVQSLGRVGTNTQAAGGSLTSNISGTLGTLTVRSDIVGATLNANGGNLGAVNVGGSLIGGPSIGSGVINSTGNMG